MSWRILIAPDSFKGSLGAREAGDAIGRGLRVASPSFQIRVVPLGDGGEGTLESLRAARGGRLVEAQVTGPLGTETVTARWAVLDPDGTAVIEMAQASGLPLVPSGRRDPLITTTAGTGELIREALDAGCPRLLVGLGGSATVDGGLGAVRALGARLLDDRGRPIPSGGRGLLSLHTIDASSLDKRLLRTPITCLVDVDNPLTGEDGASRVFGPQKGADPAAVTLLEEGLTRLSAIAARDLHLDYDLALVPGGGAAGGLGAALAAFCGARLVSGIEFVMEAAALAAHVAWSDLVVTGEGALDGQSRRGKTCAGVARLAGRLGRPVVAVVGSVSGEEEVVAGLGLSGVLPLPRGPISLIEAMEGATGHLEAAGARLARLLATGCELGQRAPCPEPVPRRQRS